MKDSPGPISLEGKKKAAWDELMERLGDEEALQDAPLDTGIRETVCALNLLGIHTLASNEGNEGPSKENGDTPYPWILFEPAEKDKSTSDVGPDYNRHNAEALRAKLDSYLQMFYADRNVDPLVKLETRPVSYGQFTLTNISEELNEKVAHETATTEEMADMLAVLPARKKEMENFGQFLKGIYFSSSANR